MIVLFEREGNFEEAYSWRTRLETMQRHPSPQWPLHLKFPSLLDIQILLRLSVAHSKTMDVLIAVQKFLQPDYYRGMRTSRTIKTTSISMEDVRLAVERGKFELCDELNRALDQYARSSDGGPRTRFGRSPSEYHSVNAFYVTELKGRRRLITEPILNSIVDVETIPRVESLGRLEKRQALKHCKWLLQIDFNRFYDAIPLHDVHVRNKFVFLGKDRQYYRLRTLPTGARWSVIVGQTITSTIVDIDTPLTILTMIDNIIIGGREGQEEVFVVTVRRILERIRSVNLETSPDRDVLLSTSSDDLLSMALANNTFLGEEYAWDTRLKERVVRNSTKTVAKLNLCMRKCPYYTCRSFVSMISLVLFAFHTTNKNPAGLFFLLKVYRAVYTEVSRTGGEWDVALNHVAPSVQEELRRVIDLLSRNEYARVSDKMQVTYDENAYDFIVYTDASGAGWGAIVHDTQTGETTGLQKAWVDELVVNPYYGPRGDERTTWFNRKHSAHAEPSYIVEVLQYLIETRVLTTGKRVAVVTDHEAIVAAQRKLNGFGGIGRGYTLNRLFELTYNMLYTEGILVVYFYIAGPQNPADTLSRVFHHHNSFGEIRTLDASGLRLPSLKETFCQLAED
ncbi:hypothetical protein, conserved [Angomonas deanei]|uniref:Reverse transcriptase domain-containing protein n=1 Tax=Angomonas deanei TaxID=59799 RepID=A0A7G2CNZ9_9TRYP|nr:hypothetical protein, conserved [Angomonas deanei]CAD2221578.1 hypothetical protein, conserved [Angomonas deanei]